MHASCLLVLLASVTGNPAPVFRPNGAESSPKEIPYPSEWETLSSLYSGQPTEVASLAFTHTQATGNCLYVFAMIDQKAVVHHHWAQFRLTRSAAPSEIDFREHKGIYSFDGETLKVCLAAPGKPRPKHFRTVPGDERLLLNLKHKKPAVPR